MSYKWVYSTVRKWSALHSLLQGELRFHSQTFLLRVPVWVATVLTCLSETLPVPCPLWNCSSPPRFWLQIPYESPARSTPDWGWLCPEWGPYPESRNCKEKSSILGNMDMILIFREEGLLRIPGRTRVGAMQAAWQRWGLHAPKGYQRKLL